MADEFDLAELGVGGSTAETTGRSVLVYDRKILAPISKTFPPPAPIKDVHAPTLDQLIRSSSTTAAAYPQRCLRAPQLSTSMRKGRARY